MALIDSNDSTTLKILHVDNIIGETCASYNEHVLPNIDEYRLSICSFFPSPVEVPESVKLYAGNGTVSSFLSSLLKCLRFEKYDIIHVHAAHTAFLAFLALLFSGNGSYRLTIFTVHSSFSNYSLQHRLLLIVPFLFSRKIVHCSWSSYHSFPYIYQVMGGLRRTVVLNGVSLDRSDQVIGDLPQQRGRSEVSQQFRMLSVGRLISVKNPFTLVEAIKITELSNLRLQFFGEGNLSNMLSDLILNEGLADLVELSGGVARDVVYREMVKADLFVSASLIEGLPIAVLEAMGCGCPVILSDIPSHRELVKNVDFIPLVNPMDIAGYSKEIVSFFSLSEPERKEIGRKCRKLVEQYYNMNLMRSRYYKLYTNVRSCMQTKQRRLL